MIRTVQIASIVEGDGEVQALPVLLRRLAAMIDPAVAVEAHPPIRLPRTKVHVLDAYERCIELASRRVAGNAGGVLVLLDVDDDCAATLGAELCCRAEAQRPDVHVAVVLAVRELEAWFLAGATSIAGRRGLPEDLEVPEEPEAIRGAKEWLQRHRTDGFAHGPTVDQPALAAVVDPELVRSRSPSFDELWREVAGLLAAAR